MYRLTEKDVEILFDIYSENKDITQEGVIKLFYKRKYKGIYEICLEKVLEYQNEHNMRAKYIFMNQNTFNNIKNYVYSNGEFTLAREIGSKDTYFMGCKVCVADIGDDEIFVVGEN